MNNETQKNNDDFTVTNRDTGETYSPNQLDQIPKVLSREAFTPLPENAMKWSKEIVDFVKQAKADYVKEEENSEKAFNANVNPNYYTNAAKNGFFPSPITVATASRTGTPANGNNFVSVSSQKK